MKVGPKAEAEEVANEVRRLLRFDQFKFPDPPRKADSASPLFGDYADEWLETIAKVSCKYSTYKDLKSVIETHLKPNFSGTPLREITRDTIKIFLAEKLKEEIAPGKKLSPSTVSKINRYMGSILTEAYESKLIPDNPTQKLGKFISKFAGKNVRTKEVNPYSREELQVFLQAIKNHKLHSRYYPFFLTAARAGLRLGELIGLQPGDLDFHNRGIIVQRNVVRGRVTSPKNGKIRRADMSKQLAKVLKKYLIDRKKETLKKGWKEPPKWLFYNTAGEIIDSNNIRDRVFYKCIDKAKLRHIRIHDLRHTFASLLIQNRESLEYVRDQLGHSSIQITVDTYGHLVPGANKEAVDRLDDVSMSAEKK